MSKNPAEQFASKSYRLFRIVFVGLILLTVIVLASVATEIASVNVRKKLDHALRLERDLGTLLSNIQDAETGQRGYLLTHNSQYLEPYHRAVDSIVPVLKRIHGEVRNDSLQLDRTGRVGLLTANKLEDIRQTISLKATADTAGVNAMLATQRGKSLMDSIRYHIVLLRQTENRDVRIRQNQLDSFSTLSTILRFLGVLGLATVFYYIYSQLQPLVAHVNGLNDSMANEIIERKRVELVNNDLIGSLNVKNRELDQFAYIASHDLREPLRTVSNFVEVLGEDYGGVLDDQGREYLSMIHRATDRMKALIETLLQYGRIGRTEALSSTDLSEVVQEALENLELRIEESGARIECGPLPVIQAYPVAMRQLFQNLLANALKFHRPGEVPRIEIRSQEIAGAVRVSVQDYGIGMDPEDQKKIFDLFSRLNSRDSYEGQGIGLAFCQKIVQLHQGTLTVTSHPGAGSTFTLTIPRSVEYEKARVRTADR